jgi:hypothetical protein
MSNNSDIKMATYFNVDESNHDIMILVSTHDDGVWNNLNVYSAYRNCLQSDEWRGIIKTYFFWNLFSQENLLRFLKCSSISVHPHSETLHRDLLKYPNKFKKK